MHQVGDQVVYGVHGVCVISGLEQRRVDHKNVEYFVLSPVDQPGASYLVPTGNALAVSKLRPLLSADEILQILDSESVRRIHWIPEENRRKQYYRELLSGGDRTAVLSMIYTLHLHKKSQLESGRKFHLCDDNFLQDAEKMLASEFSLILNIPRNQIGAYIRDRIFQ